MKKLAFLVLGSSLFAGAYSAEFIFSGYLWEGEEVPPTGSPATGSFGATLDDQTWVISGNMLISNLTSNLTGAHIHEGAVGQNGPVRFDLLANATSIDTFGNHIVVHYSGVIPGTQAQKEDLLNKMLNEMTYVNIHSSNFPVGEIRGQIFCIVPEPMTIAALGVGLAALIGRRRKK